MQAAKSLSLSRSQILRDPQAIQRIFHKDAVAKKSKPLKARYVSVQKGEGTKVLFVAPKKFYKSAVKRNKIKRVLRESYRLQQKKLESKEVHVAFIYNGPYPIDFKRVFGSVGVILESIAHDT